MASWPEVTIPRAENCGRLSVALDPALRAPPGAPDAALRAVTRPTALLAGSRPDGSLVQSERG